MSIESPHIYIIGSKEREPERIAYLECYFQQQGLSVTFFQPTWGTELSVEQNNQFVEHMDIHGRPLKSSEISVFLNFMYTFQNISAAHSSGWFLLLESDVIFEGSLAEYLQRLPPHLESLNADCVSLGS